MSTVAGLRNFQAARRPVGSRNKLSEQFHAGSQEDWEQHGRAIFRVNA